MKNLFKYFLYLVLLSLVSANAYALPNNEKKKNESEDLVTQIVPQAQVEIVEVDAIKDLEAPVTLEEKFSYAYSYLLYLSTLSQNLDINAQYYAKGAIDAAEGKALYSEKEIVEIIQEMQQEMLSRAQKQQELEAKQNLELAESFLEENMKNEEVIQTQSGLQYKIIEKGEGIHPNISDKVVVKYKIYSMDDILLLDSEGDTTFSLDTLVPGFVEGIQLMNVGSKYRFYVHPKLAYGMDGTNDIPPNSLLIFDVELIDILNDPISLAMTK